MSLLYEQGDAVWVRSSFRPGKVVHRDIMAPPAINEPYQLLWLFGVHEYQFVPESDLMLHTQEVLIQAENMASDLIFQLALEEMKSDVSKQMEIEFTFLSLSAFMPPDNGVEDESAMDIPIEEPFKSILSPTNTGHGKKRKVLDEDFINQPSTSTYVPVFGTGEKLIANDDPSVSNIPETLPHKNVTSPPPHYSQLNANTTSNDDCIATSSTAQSTEKSLPFSLDISPAAKNSESSDNFSVLSGEESDGSLIMNQKFSDLAETIINNSSKRLENGPDTIRATTKEIGFLGLGDMGSAIVYNLLNSGHFITVYNRSPEKCEEFLDDGAEKAEFPSDLIKNCDITFCCLSDENNAINSVFEGDNGLLEGFKQCKGKKRGLVMLTTLDPLKSAELSEKVSEIGGKYLEAPMIGSKKLAQEISLTLICAGDSGLFEDCVTCFASTSRDAIYVGGYVGRANQLKAVLSVITGAANVALQEAASLVCRKGLPIPMIKQCIVNSPLSCPALVNKVSDFMTNKTETDTGIKSHQKDLHVATSLADHHCLPVPLTASLKEFYLHAKHYYGQQSKEGMQIQKH